MTGVQRQAAVPVCLCHVYINNLFLPLYSVRNVPRRCAVLCCVAVSRLAAQRCLNIGVRQFWSSCIRVDCYGRAQGVKGKAKGTADSWVCVCALHMTRTCCLFAVDLYTSIRSCISMGVHQHGSAASASCTGLGSSRVCGCATAPPARPCCQCSSCTPLLQSVDRCMAAWRAPSQPSIG